jgi:hypothetical protein
MVARGGCDPVDVGSGDVESAVEVAPELIGPSGVLWPATVPKSMPLG